MRKQIKVMALGVLTATLTIGSFASAAGETLQLVDASAWGGFFSGGPYELSPMNFAFTPVGTGQFGAGAGNFISFSVEFNDQPFEGPFNYNAAIGSDAFDNGVGGGTIDPIDLRTEYLYSTFATGQLTTALNTFIYGQTASGKALQKAIWFIEEEITTVSGLAADLVALADNAVTNNGWVGSGNVHVLRLTDSNGNPWADDLVMSPQGVPLPASGLLAIVGFGCILIVRRRYFR